ncbi:MAG: hypothetical protein H6888_10915 [Nitratireductor sp.]|nr:hypothetical protein [Nitratireductor sp.]
MGQRSYDEPCIREVDTFEKLFSIIDILGLRVMEYRVFIDQLLDDFNAAIGVLQRRISIPATMKGICR